MRKVSIILLWWTRTPEIEALSIKCLHSILRNTVYPEYEIIIVRNKCDECEGSFLNDFQHEKVKIIFNPDNKGFVKGNNQGFDLAGRRDVLLLNNDTEVAKGWLTPLMLGLEKYPDAGMVMSTQIHRGSKEYEEFDKDIEKIIEWASGKTNDANIFGHTYHKMIGGNWFPLCVTLIKRELIDAIGYLDEEFKLGGHEDVDWSWRTLDAGFNLYLCGTSYIFHYYGMSFHFHQGYAEVWVETGKYLIKKH